MYHNSIEKNMVEKALKKSFLFFKNLIFYKLITRASKLQDKYSIIFKIFLITLKKNLIF